MGCGTSKEMTKQEIKKLPVYIPTLYNITVIKVYDGDTITISATISRFSKIYYKFSVRFRGIDTPEMKTKSLDEKAAAIAARDALSNKILNKKILLKDIKYDKYGRLLADVYLNSLCLNNWMLENNYGVAYDGGTKQIPKSWVDFQNGKQQTTV